jgi:hypothetical protein
MSLLQQQRAYMSGMLDVRLPGAPSVLPSWKLLVLDDLTRSIFCPLLTTAALRELGVTLLLSLSADRDPIPDVPCVYFCAPTSVNARRIGRDVSQGLYRSFHVNFLAPTPRPVLEELAAAVGQNVAAVASVRDRLATCVCADANIFTLLSGVRIPKQPATAPPVRIWSPSPAPDSDAVTAAARCIVAAAAALGLPEPLFRTPEVGPAAAVGDAAVAEVRRLNRAACWPTVSVVASRPLVLVIPRTSDPAAVLRHQWTYAGFVHDAYGICQGRVTVPGLADEVTGKRGPDRDVDIDIDGTDALWLEHSGALFGDFSLELDAQVQDYRRTVDAITQRSASAEAGGLSSALDELPEATARKARIDTHASVAFSLLPHEKTHCVSKLVAVERDAAKNPTAALARFLKSETWGQAPLPDRLRTLAVFAAEMLATATVTPEQLIALTTSPSEPLVAQLAPLMSAAQEAGLDVGALKCIFAGLGRLHASGAGASKGLRARLLSSGKTPYPLPRLVKELVTFPSGGWVTRDPKMNASADILPHVGKPQTLSSHVIVFIVGGGGSYDEAHSLLRSADEWGPKASRTVPHFIYGCESLPRAAEYLSELETLGREAA